MSRPTCLMAFIATVFLIGSTEVPAVPIPPNVPVSGHKPGLQNEEQVVICPGDPSRVITNYRDFELGYRQIGLGRSSDSGGSWLQSLLSPVHQYWARQSDPAMCVLSPDTLIMAYLDYSVDISEQPSGPSAIHLLLSPDCGQTWEEFQGIDEEGYFEDKEFVVADRSGGAFHGNVYVAWARFDDPPGSSLGMVCAAFQSASSWSLVKSDIGAPGQFAQPLVGKDGSVYVFWMGAPSNTDLRFNKSTDGGSTWQAERVIQVCDGWRGLPSGIAAPPQPVTACDISTGAHAGNLYMQYRDTVLPMDSDIMFRRSLDTGHTWSPPFRVNGDVSPLGDPRHQFHNWMVCNEEGVLVSIWYDERTSGPTDNKFDVFAAYSYDGGETWTSNHRISSVSIDPTLLISAQSASRSAAPPVRTANSVMAGLIAEYIGLDCVGNNVVATWTDTRDGDQDVYSARWRLPLTDPRLLTSDGDTLAESDTLRWATAWKENDDAYELRISTNPDMSNSILTVGGISDNAYPLSQLQLPTCMGQYYWTVKAFRTSGGAADSTALGPIHSFQWKKEVGLLRPQAYSSGSQYLRAVATLDFDRDGDLDVAAAHTGDLFGPGDIALLLNDGAGVLGPAAVTVLSGNPWHIAAADFNGDNYPDAALPLPFEDSVVILMNTMAGGFAPPVKFAAGSGPVSLITPDIDGDGDRDVLVSEDAGAGISILMNAGTGSFAPPQHFSTTASAVALVAADFDGDSLPDVAAANEQISQVSVLKNQGGGILATPDYYTVFAPSQLVAGDWDGDADLDLAVVSFFLSDIAILLNDGTGNFGSATIFPTGGSGGHSIVAADFDNDLDLDLAVPDYLLARLYILLNDGNGAFGATAVVPNGNSYPRLAVAEDMTTDCAVDVVVANEGTSAIGIAQNCAIPSGPCGCDCDCHADPAGCNAVADVTDVVQVINVSFRGAAPMPDPNEACPFERTDVDCTETTDVLDVVKIVNVAFRGANAEAVFCNPCP